MEPTPPSSRETPSSPPRSRGRPTTYSPELADLILELVRLKGLAPTAAAEEAGIGRGTLSRWRYEYPNLDSRLSVARLEYRTVRLGIVRSAATKDGRPDWRAAAWELEHAFPEDYSMNPKRRAAFRAARQAEVAAFERESAAWRAAESAACESTPAASPSIIIPKPVTPVQPAPVSTATAPQSTAPVVKLPPPGSSSHGAVPKVPKFNSAPSAALREPLSFTPTLEKFHNSPAHRPSAPPHAPLATQIQPSLATTLPKPEFESSKNHPVLPRRLP